MDGEIFDKFDVVVVCSFSLQNKVPEPVFVVN